ncbi:hypothetical protein TRFO_37678 [Tritrichomonas foetus]|uniref:Uncharacterized protein n=1 Tax=Tritrichomonas foetus TaxID=1144522 RepID=A0A1J4JBW0_9EUKA|nr:hypothetical protein TRFO_37678 [Tritrichomonas foetus]|eukprot:OHS96145.1 hypothetical protein TRFO_37678 [Tritrichomonas foetus]
MVKYDEISEQTSQFRSRMEYYDDIMEWLNEVADMKQPHESEMKKLTEVLQNESGKETYLMISEWLATKQVLEFNLFMRMIPLFRILFEKLKNASPLISQEYVDLLYHCTVSFTAEERNEVYNYLITNDLDEVPSYKIFISLFSSHVTNKLVDSILPTFLGDSKTVDSTVAKHFFELPPAYQISFARCATIYPDIFISLSIERITKYLFESRNPDHQRDGIELVKNISSPSSPRDLFVNILRIGPHLTKIEDAQNSWKIAKNLISNFSENDRFYSYQATLESKDLPEVAHSAICQQLEREISHSKSGIFRSPMIVNILPFILDISILSNLIVNLETVLTILNFLQFLLLLDRRIHCFRIFGTKEVMDNIEKCIKSVKSSLTKAIENNEKPKEEKIKGMKIMNVNSQEIDCDFDKITQSNKLSFARIQFVLNEIVDILEGK